MSEKITEQDLKELGFGYYPKSDMYGDFWSLTIFTSGNKDITLFRDKHKDFTLMIDKDNFLSEHDDEVEFELTVKSKEDLKETIELLKQLSKKLK